MNETQERLLKAGVMALGSEIDHETYRYVLEALLLHPGPVQLYCAGDGGDSGCALAIVDLIGQHGQVTGMLPGHAMSNHVTVWAACQNRYVFPMGRIGVHKVAWESVNGRTDGQSLTRWAKAFDDIERDIATVLAGASDQDVQWWLQRMQHAGSGGIVEFDAKTLIALGMARPIREHVYPRVGELPERETQPLVKEVPSPMEIQ